MKQFFFAFALFFSGTLIAQTTIVNMPTDGSVITVNDCSGIVVDGGGIAGDYTNYNTGYVVIDPAGNDPVDLTFTSWATYHTSDYIQVWDGVYPNGSSTYLGYFSSISGLPNGGLPFSGTSGAITLLFNSNYYGTAAGFVANWSTDASAAPTANFTYSAPAQNYNNPIQFVNTSTSAGEYLWDFGDGSTSTDENPTHTFTTSGANTITLIASNCLSSDTLVNSITIANAPNVAAYTDTIDLTVNCGTVATDYLTLSNASGAGALTSSFVLLDTSGTEVLNFEQDDEGTYAYIGSANISRTTVNPAQGNYALQITGADVNTKIAFPSTQTGPGFQPTYWSFKTRATTVGYRANKMQLHTGSTTSPALFGYTFWYTDGRIGVRMKTLSGVQSWAYFPNSLGNWAHIEYKNIDWVNETYDFYIDGIYRDTYAFFSPVSGVGGDYVWQIRTVNDYTSDVVYIDDIQIGNGPGSSNFSMTPTSATILGGSNSTLSFTFDATGLNAGTYSAFVIASSNDTTLNGDTIYLNANVVGDYAYSTPADTLDFGTVANGVMFSDSMAVFNTGCADLIVDSVVCVNSLFTTNLSNVLAYDTAQFHASITASAAGLFLDSAIIYTPDSSFTIYLKANAVDAPDIEINSSTVNYTFAGCTDTVDIPFWIFNEGQQTLNYNLNSVSSVVTPACPITIQLTDSYGDGWNGARVELRDSDGNVIDTYGSTFYTGTSQSNLVYLCSGDTYSLVVTATGSWPSEIGVNILENGSIIASYSNSSSTTVGTQMTSWSTNCGAPCANPSDMTFDPSSGSVTAADSELVYIQIYADSLVDGMYTYTGFLTSNDPVDSAITLTINLTIDGASQTYTNRSSCLDLDTLVVGATMVDSFYVQNIGCDSLYFNSFTATNSMFSGASTSPSMGVFDGQWVYVTVNPTAVGTIADTVFMHTSDTIWPICYTGYVVPSPNIWVDNNTISLTTANCGDTLTFDVPIVNTVTNTSLDWAISSDDAVNVLLVNRNVYPGLATAVENYLNTLPNVFVETVTTTTAVPAKLEWADVVIFTPVNASAIASDYTSIENDMNSFITDGGKMMIMGSLYVNEIIAMNFISGYYYGNYTNYTHWVNSSLGSPYVQNMPTNFVGLANCYNAYIYNTGTTSLVYYSTYSRALSVSPIGDGELIYFGFNFNTVYPEIETLMGNIMSSTLASKSTGLNWASFSPATGTTTGGDTTTVTATVYTAGLNAGDYTFNVQVSSNDPTGGTVNIPVSVSVNGEGETILDAGCEVFGDSYKNVTTTQNVAVYNTGCDSLSILSTTTVSGTFVATPTTITIGPGDTTYVPVSITATTTGVLTDTLVIYSDVDTSYKCLTVNILNSPICTVTPSPLNVTLNKCNTFTTVPITIQNTGNANLNFTDINVEETYDSTSVAYWGTYSSSVYHTFYNVLDVDTLFFEFTVNGGYSSTSNYFYIYLNGYSASGALYDNNLSNSTDDVMVGYVTGPTLQNILNSNSTITAYTYRYNFASNVGNNMSKLRLYGSKPSNWASPVGATSGNLVPNQSVTKNILISASTLAVGTYTSEVIVSSNDPGTPNVVVPLTVNVVNAPDMSMSSNNVAMGNVFGTAPVRDSIYIENLGCVDLNITSVQSSNGKFVADWTSMVVPSGNTIWFPWTFTGTAAGFESGAFTFISNDTASTLSVSANVVFPAVADYQFNVMNTCNGLVSFTNESSNGTSYFWDFQDGLFSTDQSPLHTFEKPGVYTVMLITSNSASSDTIYKTVDMSDVLYASAEYPDTVQALTNVQFIDSSMVPNSWQWFFGDGNTSNSPNSTHMYNNKGTFIVSLLVSNAAGCSKTFNGPIYVTSGIGIEENIANVRAYPNPTTGVISFETTTSFDRLRIFDAKGQLISDGIYQPRIDVGNLPAGAYNAVLVNGQGSVSVPFVVMH